MLGEEEDDLSDDLSGLPFERRIGVDEVREKEGLGEEVVSGKGTLACCGLERGDVRGKGTESGAAAFMTGTSSSE